MNYRRALLAAILALCCASAALAGKTRNVVLIVSDGLRPEEVYSGAEEALFNETIGGNWISESEMRARYGDPDAHRRRERLLPFIWGTVAARGQLFGNAQLGSSAVVANPYSISYPGYSEMITGVADPHIDSNEYGRNPNVSVFEWLAGKPAYAGKVAVFGTWFKFHDIFNEQRSHLPVRSGDTLVDQSDTSPRGQLFQQLARTTTRLERDDPYDSFLAVSVMDYLQKHRPRVMFIGFGDTDNWAHSGRYDLLLDTAHTFDSYVAALWNRLQSLPEYRDQTTFIITTDHGRGHGPVDWKEHGVEEHGSENIWIAVIGPDTKPLGERTGPVKVTQSQIAATIAALLGEDFPAALPAAAAALPGVTATP